MKCTEIETLVAAWADGQTDSVQADFVQRHLQSCPECAARHQALVQLREHVRAEVPRYRAPAALRARVLRSLEPQRTPARTAWAALRERWPWVTGGALAGCMATALAWTVGTAVVATRNTDDVAIAAVSTHGNAALAGRLIEVETSDRHTVKPWLSARLDYSPPVQDLAGEGFPLLGGRLDYLEGRRTATLVYGHGKHSIDVFVRPLQPRAFASTLQTVRGLHVVRAAGPTMEWIGVSDVETDALTTLVKRLAREDVPQ